HESEVSVCEARIRSKHVMREAGPRGICGGGPSAELHSERTHCTLK
ncbi:hypothetical protein F443_13428, partial [Phytophthora nicotianae P1569]